MESKPGYLLVMGTAFDQESMDRYQATIPPIYEQYKGYRLGMGEPPGDAAFLSGSLKDQGVMLARFPSPSHVSGFWWSDDYRAAYSIRKDAGEFAVVGLRGVDQEPDPLPGSRSYLLAIAASDSASQGRAFADALGAGLNNLGAEVLVDAGPESTERLEGTMPGSHFLIAMMPPGRGAKSVWAEIERNFDVLREAAQSVHVISLEGLPADHPERLTRQPPG